MTEPEPRVVTHETEDTRIIAAVRRTPETDEMSDDEIVAQLDKWKRKQRHLRAVDDE
ncbi:hypothetical protein ACWEQ7_04205 [Streptomyces sp. NPDC004069]